MAQRRLRTLDDIDPRASKQIEELYLREYGFVFCRHNVYLPTEHCETCAAKALVDLKAAIDKEAQEKN